MTEQSGQLTTVSRRLNREIDLAELIFITMDKNMTDTREIFRFLNALFVNINELSTFIPYTEDNKSIYEEANSMCDIGDWREAIGEEKGIEKGIEKGEAKKEEELIFTFLSRAITPEMTSETILAMLCRFFGFSREVAQEYYERYTNRNS